jgi:Spy/CpxP family protein refolding chaperone
MRQRTPTQTGYRAPAAAMIFSAAMLLAAGPTFAQQRPSPPPPGAGPGAESDEAGDLQETLEIYMLAKMKRALALTPDQEQKVVPLVQDLSDSRRRFHRDRRLAIMTLRPMVEDPNSTEEEIRATLARLDQAESSFRSSESHSIAQIRALLSTRQQAQFMIFQESFRAEMQQRLREFRQGGAGGPPMQRGPRRLGSPPSPGDGD